jgi:hypothetical protein
MRHQYPLLLRLAVGLGGGMITRTPGFYSGYKRLAPSEQQQIHFLPTRQLVPNSCLFQPF